ncbi:Ig-like domain-containing protein [Candidatus Saccharibacteria bacterium]|nr:Ig-like domain-containing protein [Candidatus Saccharibacteria bacterium]
MADNSKTTQAKARASHVAPGAVRKSRFRPRIWHGLVLILVILVIGVLIVRLSKASGDTINLQAAKTLQPPEITRYQTQFGARASTNTKPTVPVSGQANLSYGGKDSPKFVAYYVDGNLKATESNPPYTYTLDTTALSNGQHTIALAAYDQNNLVINLIQQRVNVINGGRLQMIQNSLSYPWKVILGDN